MAFPTSPLYRPAIPGHSRPVAGRIADPVIEADELTAELLRKLFDGNCLCVRIKNAISAEQCDVISEALQNDTRRGVYEGAPAVGRVGDSTLYEANISPEKAGAYWAQTARGFKQNRNLCPHPYPTDGLRCELDEKWLNGCNLLRLGGKIAYAGVARVLTSTAAIDPHQDVLGWDAPDEFEAHQLIGQLAANFYLSVADQGGELDLFDTRLSAAEYEAHLDGYGLDRKFLGEPVMTVRPHRGDLILFDSTRVHAVRSVQGEMPRVTASCFIGLSRLGNLVVWS